jgi:hypothetical protein
MRKIKGKNGWTLLVMEKWETLNPHWQPKKWIALVNSELAEKGFTPATKQDIEANYMAMLQLSQDDLTALAGNKEKPMLVRIIAKNMLGGKGFDIIEKMLDRGIGKAVQKNEVSGSLEVRNELSEEEMTALKEIWKKQWIDI